MKTIIQTPTANLKESVEFYTKLNFQIISDEGSIVVTDDQVVIEINPNRFARAGIKIYHSNWKVIVEQLREQTKVIDIENGYLLSDGSGTWIYLINEEWDEMAMTVQLDKSILGNFAGVSLEVIDIEKAMKIYQILGFQPSMGSLEQGWIALTNEEGMSVSLMKPNSCPHLFFNPSLTFFNGKNNLEVIEKVRKLNIPIAEEITHFNKEGKVDNIILRDNGGFGFFLFSD